MDCDNFIQRRVKLGYVADSPTSIQLVDSIGNQVFDLLPVIQAGETDTSIELITETRRIRYYPEEYTRTEGQSGCFYDICIPDIAALIDLNELRNVANPTTLATGETIVYNATTQQYEMFNLTNALQHLQDEIDAMGGDYTNLVQRVTTLENKILEQNQKISQLTELVAQYQQAVENLTTTVNAISGRVSDIEGAIYNWSSDKTTKIPRGNINVTSGGYNSNNGIYTRAVNTNNDLNFS
ncbi:MAG: hypothetical protein IIY21_25410 [Clostridiales bacterium]|nr:hypothetical protein [Clostridiales bacterium]